MLPIFGSLAGATGCFNLVTLEVGPPSARACCVFGGAYLQLVVPAVNFRFDRCCSVTGKVCRILYRNSERHPASVMVASLASCSEHSLKLAHDEGPLTYGSPASQACMELLIMHAPQDSCSFLICFGSLAQSLCTTTLRTENYTRFLIVPAL